VVVREIVVVFCCGIWVEDVLEGSGTSLMVTGMA
jgi:hypothetical protein